MDAQQAARNLEVIRTLMERTCQYQLLTARAGLVAGSLAGVGALAFLYQLDRDLRHFYAHALSRHGGSDAALFAVH